MRRMTNQRTGAMKRVAQLEDMQISLQQVPGTPRALRNAFRVATTAPVVTTQRTEPPIPKANGWLTKPMAERQAVYTAYATITKKARRGAPGMRSLCATRPTINQGHMAAQQR